MCRFVAYLGKDPLILETILEKPENSLVRQSRQARESKLALNADGFGIGWYNHAISPEPGTFKSVQPAWNDLNLRHLSRKLESTCFIGHVRASTVGDVGMVNCHPFAYDSYLFVHNGTIRGFEPIRRRVVNMLSEKSYESIRGQTDSEHFLALMMDTLELFPKPHGLVEWGQAFVIALKKIISLKGTTQPEQYTRLNTVLTDGKKLLTTRYASPGHTPLSLYYALGDGITVTEQGEFLIPNASGKSPRAIVIASEPMGSHTDAWHEVPDGQMMMVTKNLDISFKPITL